MMTAPHTLLMMFSTFSLNLAPSSDTMVESARNQITDALPKPQIKGRSPPAGRLARKAPSIMVPSMMACGLNHVTTKAVVKSFHTGRELARTCLGNGVSMGIHESQSRFYENIIGRSRAFCSVLLPWLKEHFPAQLEDVTEEQFYRMVNRSRPSLIRTEADELTYCLHIMVRYELEKQMFAGTITAHDLPAAWNRLYKEYLGVDVPSDREGVLQDSHWANGNIGYFPSYAIGSAYGAQYLLEMQKDLDVEAAVRSGKLTAINRWLEEKIWKYGCMKDPVALFESVCGPFRPEEYVAYLEKKVTDIYDL